ncbi:MBL fold metallo-hydrolase [Candidatus Dependentiae bacterium]|nr:MBL fold metallo-hydrolase [Candidatus Dependentiae bacterium]
MSEKKNHKINPHIHKGRFYNKADENCWPHIVPTLDIVFEVYWKTFRRKAVGMDHWCTPTVPPRKSVDPLITWIGHSTFLIQIAGINIVTDPIFGDLTFLFKRLMKPGVALHDIPPIDYVLISHNHPDHMDAAALLYFKKHPATHFLVPQGNKRWFTKRGFERVTEYNWWESDTFKTEDSPCTFTFLPAHHWSQRGIFDFNKTLWGSWMITILGHSIYFAGDTAYSPHFTAINKEFPSISCALLPIGPCEPNHRMKLTHMNAEEAGQSFLDLQARTFIPMHWGTYSFGTDDHEGPYDRINKWWTLQQLDLEKKLIILKAGQAYNLPDLIELVPPQPFFETML